MTVDKTNDKTEVINLNNDNTINATPAQMNKNIRKVAMFCLALFVTSFILLVGATKYEGLRKCIPGLIILLVASGAACSIFTKIFPHLLEDEA